MEVQLTVHTITHLMFVYNDCIKCTMICYKLDDWVHAGHYDRTDRYEGNAGTNCKKWRGNRLQGKQAGVLQG